MIGSTSGISFGGIASGLDTEGIIAKLVAIDKSSVARLTQQNKQLAGNMVNIARYSYRIRS